MDFLNVVEGFYWDWSVGKTGGKVKLIVAILSLALSIALSFFLPQEKAWPIAMETDSHYR